MSLQQVASHTIHVTCVDGDPHLSNKGLVVHREQGAAVINWIADNTVHKILAVAFIDASQTEFVLLRALNDKHWQCIDRCTTDGLWDYVLIAQCKREDGEAGEPNVADPYIQNQP